MVLQRRYLLCLSALVLLSFGIVPTFGFYNPLAVLLVLAAFGAAFLASVQAERFWVVAPEWSRLLLLCTSLLLLIVAGIGPLSAGVLHLLGLDGDPSGVVSALMLPSGGWTGLVAAIALVVMIAAYSRRARPLPSPVACLAPAGFLLSGLTVCYLRLLYAQPGPALEVLDRSVLIGFFLMAVFSLGAWQRPGPGLTAWVAVVFVTGALVRISTVIAAPDPIIDVYTLLDEAPGHLLRGENPYSADYSNVYESARARKLGTSWPAGSLKPPAYPPLPYLMALPFHATSLDVRYANVLCELVAAGVLLAGAWLRGNALLGAAAAGTYLQLPHASFIIEQAWYEPMLAAALGGGLLLVERKHRWGYLLLGVGLTGKQFGLFLLPPLWKACWRQTGWLLLGIGAAVLAIIVPFLWWDPQAFLDIVIFKHFDRPVKTDSITVASLLENELGWHLPRFALMLAGVALIAWIAWRTPVQAGLTAAPGLAAALLAFCLCHTQGYFNYFYLCQYLLLLSLVGLQEPKPREPAVLPGTALQ